ncbi:phosphoenolpyruvate-utilizing protein [Photobacterium aquimaris]|uniref:Phosphoenolpyruvate-utilizing protein n=1 Tax=Photobacterium aquimaris TaxID=512643 RepID=A0A2T3ITG2_9GAMM|nr:putative PEP-binding protein [Photobacterium aquimaris]PSU31630.1 phosphoenolpyruvate-utilizing protein [Photobacterium aquimaris]PSW03314.1 phosphoenolpyruvate-utilizing protein [Photobacterium aquimaris]
MTTQTQLLLATTAVLRDAQQLATLNNKAIGLVSLDDLIATSIGIHPLVFAQQSRLSEVTQQALQQKIADQYGQQTVALAEYYVSMLTELLVSAARQQGSTPLKVQLISADSSSRQQLLGAELETVEVNPQLGLRGASFFADKNYKSSFALQCEAIKRARAIVGGENIELVVPFVRTFSEAATMIDLLAEQGLCRGANGLKVHMLCCVPANALLAETFIHYFDGFVVDVEQLAQFALGQDFDNPGLNYRVDTQNDAVIQLLKMLFAVVGNTAKDCDIYCRSIEQSPRLQRWLNDHEITTVIC